MTVKNVDAGWTPKLIASDIDGTFINDAERVPPELAELVGSLDGRAQFVLATGRPYRWIEPVVQQLRVRPMCVCSNGAVIFDSATSTVIKAIELEPETMKEFARQAQLALADAGGASVAVELAEPIDLPQGRSNYLLGNGFLDAFESTEGIALSDEEVLARPAVKMLLRNCHLTAAEMYERVAPAVSADLAEITFSIEEGLLEISPKGVHKAAGLAYLTEFFGIDAQDVVAFGDMPNDIEMLSWAGLGVAMGNAADVVKQAADEITGSNNEAGVAQVLSRWF